MMAASRMMPGKPMPTASGENRSSLQRPRNGCGNLDAHLFHRHRFEHLLIATRQFPNR